MGIPRDLQYLNQTAAPAVSDIQGERMKRTSPISSSPGAWLLNWAVWPVGIAAGMAAEGLRQMASGSLPRPRSFC